MSPMFKEHELRSSVSRRLQLKTPCKRLRIPIHKLYLWKVTVAKKGPQAKDSGKEGTPLRTRVSVTLQTSKEPVDDKDPSQPALPPAQPIFAKTSFLFPLPFLPPAVPISQWGKKSQESVGNKFSDCIYIRIKAIICIIQDKKLSFASSLFITFQTFFSLKWPND